MTSQIDSHETNEAESSGREEIIMETFIIVTSSNKSDVTYYIKNHDNDNNYDNNDENEDDMSIVFASSMLSYTPIKCSLSTEGTCITELLQFRDSEEKTMANNKRPDILTMTNQMYHALNTSLDSSSVINMTTTISQTTKSALSQEEKALARL
ncbi:8529_t:CDS:2 [Funneliformis geosporum]|nr:8529_t:CDS:2 [Funneliformis geosporum]